MTAEDLVADAVTAATADDVGERSLALAAEEAAKRSEEADQATTDAKDLHSAAVATEGNLQDRAQHKIAEFNKLNQAVARKLANNIRHNLVAPAAERASQDATLLLLSDAVEYQRGLVAEAARGVGTAERKTLQARRDAFLAQGLHEAMKIHRQILALKAVDPFATVDFTAGNLSVIAAEISELDLELVRLEKRMD